MMKLSLALAAVSAVSFTTSAQARDWVKDKSQCQYERGLRDSLAIEDGRIVGYELECIILKSQLKDGYTYADISCSAEEQKYKTSIRFKVDDKGLHYQSGKSKEELFPYACP